MELQKVLWIVVGWGTNCPRISDPDASRPMLCRIIEWLGGKFVSSISDLQNSSKKLSNTIPPRCPLSVDDDEDDEDDEVWVENSSVVLKVRWQIWRWCPIVFVILLVVSVGVNPVTFWSVTTKHMMAIPDVGSRNFILDFFSFRGHQFWSITVQCIYQCQILWTTSYY